MFDPKSDYALNKKDPNPSTYIHTQKYRASAIRTPPAH